MIGAVALGGILVGGALGGVAYSNSGYDIGYKEGQEDFVPQIVTEIVTEQVDVPVEVITEVEVMVDNGNMDLVLEHIYDNEGEVEYLLDDLDDDELDLIVDRISFINDIKAMAVAEVKSEIADEVDKMEISLAGGSTMKLDEDDIERIRVDDDADEVSVRSIDFEDEDAKLELSGSFEQDDVKFDYAIVAKFKDGEFDEFKEVEVSERV